MSGDYYSVLGVTKSSSSEEIKKAYRKLAMQYHPDKNPNDKAAEAKFKEINDAYQVLGDEDKKRKYDSYGHSAYTQSGGGGGGYSSGGGGFDFDFSDVFSSFFGGGSRGGNPFESSHEEQVQEGDDLRYNLEITLKESYDGMSKTISFQSIIKCDPCGGKGGTNITTCTTCGGHGKVRMQKGFFVVEQTCNTCHGSGKKIQNACKNCSGSGRVRANREVQIQIPKGVESGTKLKVAGYGEYPGRGGRYGDLYVFITIKPHDFFTRQGTDLHCAAPIKFTTAILGGEVTVPTISGSSVLIKVPQGTQNGTKLKVSGKGMPSRNNLFGNMIVEINIEIPVNLTKEQKDIIQQLDTDIEMNSSPKFKSFTDKIKSMFN